jgi:hypothetical protein
MTSSVEKFYTDDTDTIFVSIASYRDAQCPRTIESLFSRAKHPNNVYVGICQQNKEDEDVDCFDSKWKSQIRMIRIPHFEAKGPTWARYLCSTLWSGEKYYFQIDSHSLFAQDWDVKLISMIKLLKSRGVKKPILSHYPKMLEDHDNGDNTVPTICKSFFNDRNMISFLGAHNITITEPRIGAYVAGGMFFAESDFLKEVPFDPNLPYLFVGEEILHSVRFWTHGWDIYTPTENVVYHFYTRENEPKIWTDKNYRDDDAFSKVKQILGIDGVNTVPSTVNENIEKYGLGKERTLEQYFKFAGINKDSKTVEKDFCYDTITYDNL